MGDKRDIILSELKSDLISKYSVHRGQINTFLTLSNEYQLFGCKDSPSVSYVIGQINSSLGTRKCRLNALQLLQHVINQCTTDVFAQHWQYWTKTIFQIVQTDDNYVICQLAAEVLDSLLFYLKSSEFGHQFASSSLTPLLTEIMLKLKDRDQSRHLILIKVFTTVAKYFPGPCGPFAGKIENYLIPMFDSSDHKLQHLAAECFAVLPQCGGGGNAGLKHTEFWSKAAERLLSGLHDVLDQLYYRLEPATTWPHRGASNLLRFQDVEVEEPCRTTTLAVRFRGLCCALNQLLSHDFPAVVRLPVLCILELIDRTLAVTPAYLLAKPTSLKIHLAVVVPLVHEQAFDILQSLTSSARRELVPYAEVINGWLSQSLNWSNTAVGKDVDHVKYHRSFRCKVYSTLTLWMQSLGGASGTEIYARNIIRHVINDCSPSTSPFKFKVSSKLAKVEAAFSSIKKRKTNHAIDDLDQSAMHCKVDVDDGSELCIASLQVLRNLLLYCGHSLSTEQFRAITDLCRLPLTQFFRRTATEILAPYHISECRKSVYQLLLSILTSSSSQRPSPDQIIMRSFSIGLNDHSLEVRHCCAEALAIAENIVHPRLPALGIHAVGGPVSVSASDDCIDTSAFEFPNTHFESLSRASDAATSESMSSVIPVARATSEPVIDEPIRSFNVVQPIADASRSQAGSTSVDWPVVIRQSEGLQGDLHNATVLTMRQYENLATSSLESSLDVLTSCVPLQSLSAMPVSPSGLAEDLTESALEIQSTSDDDVRLSAENVSEVQSGCVNGSTRKRKYSSGSESESNEIQPADLEDMIKSFSYT